MRFLKAEQFPEDGGPLAHPVRPTRYREINNFYTATVYEKGSEVTRMIATLLGRDLFKAGMDLYFERHDGQAVTIEDFIACFAAVSGRDLSQFALWYHQAGTPLVSASGSYDAGRQRFTLSLEQMVPPTPGQSSKEPMHIPLRLALVLEDGSIATPSSVSGGEMTGDVLHLTERSQTLVFEGIASRPVVSLNRDFSAPINLHLERTAAERAHLARYETDPFARWQALNDMALLALVEGTASVRTGETFAVELALIEALLAAARDETLEPAFRAQALALPSESDIAREIGRQVDPDAIFAARQQIMTAIAKAGASDFAALYDRMAPSGPFSPMRQAPAGGRCAMRRSAISCSPKTARSALPPPMTPPTT